MDKTVAVDNVNMNNEEKVKHKKKDKKSKKRVMAVAAEVVHNVDTIKPVEPDRISENEDISEAKRDHKSIKGKKKKMKKNKGAKDAAPEEEKKTKKDLRDEDNEADMKNGSKEAGMLCENGGGQKLNHAERKSKRREKKNKKEISQMQDTEEVERDGGANCQEGESVSGKESAKEVMKEKKEKKKVKRKDIQAGVKDGEVIKTHSENCSAQKKEKSKAAQQDNVDNENNSLLNTKESQNNEAEFTRKKNKKKTKCAENGSNDDQDNEAEYANKRKKRKGSLVVNGLDDTSPNKSSKKVRFSDQVEVFTIPTNSNSEKAENGSNDDQDNEAEYANKRKKRKGSLVVNGLDDTSPNKSSKKVRFSDHDEVFTIPTNSDSEKVDGEVDDLVRGKRFTREEDKIVKDAVLRYIEEKHLGDEGLEMVLNCSKHSNLKGCWKEIASAIPYRPYIAVYNRARIIFMRSESRKWTQEELNMVLEYQEKNGNEWKPLADELGKHTWHVKDAWRRIKLPNMNKGTWSQQEYQKLFDLVNTDLQLKLSEEKKSKHGMLRDNICWTAISDTLSTRAQAACCLKWYKQLTSAMVAEGVWADSDDYRLLCALYSLDATCVEDVDWDDLIDHRPGDICRKRWNQMVLHIGENGTKSFAEQVEVLAQRYCPNLLEARETWDNKPRVP